MSAGRGISLARWEEGGRYTCGRDPLRGRGSNLNGEAGKHDTTERVWEGREEGWKKDGKESTPVNNEILKGRLELDF